MQSGGVTAGIAASWSFGAILGAFVVVGMSLIALGMKISADHRRKKRAYQASAMDQAQQRQKHQERTHGEGERRDEDDLEEAGVGGSTVETCGEELFHSRIESSKISNK